MGRAPCCEKNGLKKGPWTPEEDQKLIDYIQINGCGNWRTLPKNAGLQRCGKSCRLRWTNYLRPDIKRGRFSLEEEETIIQLHSILGNKWSAIAARLPGRTDNEIKNYWNTHIRKRLLKMGIDPVTHSPRLDLLDLSSILSSSLYSSNQMNLSRLLGVQPLVNPELLRLATNLVRDQAQSFVLPNNNIQEDNPQILYQQEIVMQPNSQLFQIPTSTSLFPNGEQFTINDHSINPQLISQDWNCGDDFAPLPGYYNGCSFDSNPGAILDHHPSISEGSTLNISNSNNNNNNNNNNNIGGGGFVSVLSTPSSSPATYVNSTGSTTTEDESYSTNKKMGFEIPADIFDVSNFMYS